MAAEQSARPYRFGDFYLPADRRALIGPDGPVHLSSRAIDILSVLVERRKRIVPKDELMTLVWPDTFVEENNLTVHISALRKTIGAARIATIPGRGYQFTGPVEDDPAMGASASLDVPEAPADMVLPTSNLPDATTPLIGRGSELAELHELSERHRLLTITGPSGIGKTRLAVALADALRPRYPDGVWLVDLAPLTSPAMVLAATATVLSVVPGAAGLSVDTVATAIRQRSLLLLFDNCEHVLPAVVELIDALLRQAPAVAALATSQENLRSRWEQVFRLDPLELPPADARDIHRFGAIELFIARVRALDRRFELVATNMAAIAEICRELDGIPLALEMAAARVPMFGVEELRNRLGDRLHVLTTGPRTLEARHQTLRDTVAWSHGLLDPTSAAVFRRLAIFVGGFTLEAASAVVSSDGKTLYDTIEGLSRLVDKSLVVVEGRDRPRYRLLETLRLYALERLDESGEAAEIAARHAQYFAASFDEASAAWETTPDKEWLERHVPDLDNVRAALDWAFGAADRRPLAVKLAGASALLWLVLSLVAEGRAHTDRALEFVETGDPSPDAARLLRYAGLFWHAVDHERAMTLLQRSSDLYRRQSDPLGLGAVQAFMASIHIRLGQEAKAAAALSVAKTILVSSSSPKSLFNVMNNLGSLALLGNRLTEARTHFETALALARSQRNLTREALILANLAEVEFSLGQVDQAVERGRETVRRLRQAGVRAELGWALGNLASYLLAQGNGEEARPVAGEALSLVREEGGFIVRVCLLQWALLGALDGNPIQAARLLGFVDAGFDAAGETLQPTERQIRDRLWSRLTGALAAERIAAAAAEGARWSEDDAVSFVVRELLPAPE
ncbi:MAG TPA: winged helix-turn-helix domain-containing protein [Aliidongia sp.]|uniref:ATP-binding protein n=1 Tax=Aliidongia sp. TaxID=1914230 RepID=UPI002DDD029A|nr:winged helix-turn-helix domain-containing protein [Aliidongia sp.]HEV2674530.1 winged helix-turn-helix domain-containing protein [Aliidongia sp.]